MSSFLSNSHSFSESCALSLYYNADQPLWSEILLGRHHWSARIRRGTVLKFRAQASNANLSVLYFNAEEKLERYSMADTLCEGLNTIAVSRAHHWQNAAG